MLSINIDNLTGELHTPESRLDTLRGYHSVACIINFIINFDGGGANLPYASSLGDAPSGLSASLRPSLRAQRQVRAGASLRSRPPEPVLGGVPVIVLASHGGR